MAFSVQFATEFTSAAAPRTVLHADMAIDPPIIAIVITLRSMLLSPVVTPQSNAQQHETAPLRYRNFPTAQRRRAARPQPGRRYAGVDRRLRRRNPRARSRRSAGRGP